MRVAVAILLLCLGDTAAAKDKSVTLLIAPRSLQLPASGKMVFDVYWHNWTDKPAQIPALDTYALQSSIIVPGQESGGGGTIGRGIDHPAPDRTIAPHAVIHDTITAKVALTLDRPSIVAIKANKIVQVSLVVWGEYQHEFESNTVVFTQR